MYNKLCNTHEALKIIKDMLIRALYYNLIKGACTMHTFLIKLFKTLMTIIVTNTLTLALLFFFFVIVIFPEMVLSLLLYYARFKMQFMVHSFH